MQRLDRDIWKRWCRYHRRSLVDTKMRCIKFMDERVMARDFDRQVAELQVRAAILNRFTQFGTPETVRVWCNCVRCQGQYVIRLNCATKLFLILKIKQGKLQTSCCNLK